MLDWLIALQRPFAYRKRRLIDPLVPKTGVRRATVYGTSFDLDLSDLIQRNVYLGCYERDETTVFKRLLSDGNTLIDIGANIGYFTALGAHLVGPAGRVICVEPNPSAFAKLQSMITQNNLAQCRPINVGLSDQTGQLTLFQPPESEHNLNSTMVQTEGYTPINVPIRTLDDVVEEFQIDRVDLLKCDVEGHEPKVFQGGAKTLSSGRVRHIICEFNAHWLKQSGSSPQDLLQRLKGFGFEVIPGAGNESDIGNAEIVNLLLKHRSH